MKHAIAFMKHATTDKLCSAYECYVASEQKVMIILSLTKLHLYNHSSYLESQAEIESSSFYVFKFCYFPLNIQPTSRGPVASDY